MLASNAAGLKKLPQHSATPRDPRVRRYSSAHKASSSITESCAGKFKIFSGGNPAAWYLDPFRIVIAVWA
jgi:hypothetical protein